MVASTNENKLREIFLHMSIFYLQNIFLVVCRITQVKHLKNEYAVGEKEWPTGF